MLPFSPLHLIALIFLLGLLIIFLQLGLLTLTFEKLGLSPSSALNLLIVSLIGSIINLPILKLNKSGESQPQHTRLSHGLLRGHLNPLPDKIIVAINVGGGVIPVMMCLYLIQHSTISLLTIFVATILLSAICYIASKPIPGIGIGMPIFLAPVAAAMTGILLGGDESAPLAYICGTLGVLIGADILRLRDIQSLGTSVASIGGAGTFDGIFLTGIVAALLA